MHALREKRASDARKKTASSKHSSSRRLSLKSFGSLPPSSPSPAPHSRYYNVSYILAGERVPWRRAAQPLRSNLFRSFPPSRYRSVAERVMDVGASRFYAKTYETRGVPLRSSASDVGHFIRFPLPLTSLLGSSS